MTVTIVILLRFLNLTYLKIHECGRYSYMELTLNLVWRAMAIALLGRGHAPFFSVEQRRAGTALPAYQFQMYLFLSFPVNAVPPAAFC